MKRLWLLSLLSALPIWAGDLVIGDKSYTFAEIIAQTKFHYDVDKGATYSNPFDTKVAKIIIIAGTSRKSVAGTKEDKERFWYVPLPPLTVRFEPDEGIPPFYELNFLLVPVTKTPQGAMSFRVSVAEAKKQGLPYDIFNAFIESMEKRRELRVYTDRPAAIELTGVLDLSGAVQPKSDKWAQIDYTFLPTDVEVLNSKP